MLRHLIPLIDTIPHKIYVEPFFGGGALFFKKTPVISEIINDIDNQLYNLYRQLQRHPAEIVRMLRFMPKSRRHFFDCVREYSDPRATEIERAAAFLYANKNSFGASNRSFAIENCGRSEISQSNYRRLISAVSHRLNKVCIESLDAERCIKLYDHEDTLFFCDPPYTVGKNNSYELFDADKMRSLVDLLRAVKGRFVLTINDSPENREIVRGLDFVRIGSKYSLRKTNRAQGQSELIVADGPIPKLKP